MSKLTVEQVKLLGSVYNYEVFVSKDNRCFFICIDRVLINSPVFDLHSTSIEEATQIASDLYALSHQLDEGKFEMISEGEEYTHPTTIELRKGL